MSNENKIKFAFFGTPELTIPILDTLFENGYIPSVIVTMPDRPQGRKMTITPPPTKVWALSHNIPVLQPEKLDDAFLLEIGNLPAGEAGWKLDLFIVVAYGKILPEALINMPDKGTLNIHYSLLPKYRGATPVESAILNGDTETGVAIQQMVFKLDAGPILKSKITEIGENETAPELRDRLNEMAKDMLVEVLGEIENDTAKANPQDDSQASRCGKIQKEDGLIDLSDEPVKNWRKYKAYFNWPRVYFIKDGKRVIVTDAIFENGEFKIKKVLPEGKKEITWEEFKRQS